ncbi:MAG: VWA domain-containing protein [Acidobacteria bacterium]|nr:VWA domain-containing protein [Acidobacteriota bacterium]
MSINATFSSSSPKPHVTRRREARERGIAVILTAMMLLFTMPAVGLAIDAGLLYLIRARMSAACDAASLATARNLNLGQTLAEQIGNATARGQVYFNANFPNNYLGVATPAVNIQVTQLNMNTLRVFSTATGNAPVYFMKILGGNTALAGGAGTAVRRDVNLALVLDRSGSMQGQPCTDMINSSKNFTNQFVNQRDRIGLVTFGAAVYNAYTPTKDFQNPSNSVNSKINSVTCAGWTNTSNAYWNAYQMLQAINEPLALNIIVFFTDGMPTSFTAKFPIKTVSDTRYGANGLNCTSTSSQCTISKSSCVDDNGYAASHASWGTFAGKTGAMTGGSVSATTGDTNGLIDPVATSFSTSDPRVGSSISNGCAFAGDQRRTRRDVAFIPATNVNGLATTGYKSLTLFSSGHPYYNKIRPDMPINVTRVGMNLADNAAATIRNDTTLNVVTYTIGLDGNGGVDDDLLKRMANDLGSSIYDDTKEHGVYAYASNSSQLNLAYSRILSDILRLTN